MNDVLHRRVLVEFAKHHVDGRIDANDIARLCGIDAVSRSAIMDFANSQSDKKIGVDDILNFPGIVSGL